MPPDGDQALPALIAQVRRRMPGLRLGATHCAWDVLMPAVLEQKVTGPYVASKPLDSDVPVWVLGCACVITARCKLTTRLVSPSEQSVPRARLGICGAFTVAATAEQLAEKAGSLGRQVALED